MREEVKKRNWTSVKVHSADGFQANEADLVYILTTRSTPVADSLLRLIREKVLDFIRDERRDRRIVSGKRRGHFAWEFEDHVHGGSMAGICARSPARDKNRLS